MKMNKFLIVLVYYERPKIVLNALNSILNCSYENFEVAFIDDGSSQRGEEVVRNHCSSIIDKFKFYYINNTIEDKKNQGGSMHGEYMNTTIYESDADYVMILCDDDAIYPDFLQKFNTLLNNEGDDVKPYYYSNVILYDALNESYTVGIKNNNLSHFTNKHTEPINCNFAVDSSQVVYSRKLFVENNLSYPFPQTKNLDAYIYQSMFVNWGPAYYSGLISQVKSWNGDNLGAKSGDSDYITNDIKK
jgi:glycosyltransferase involved in cell wall biosynthesis